MFSQSCIRVARASSPHGAPAGFHWPSHRSRAGMCRVIPDMPMPPPNAVHTPVHVVETSLGITKDVRLLRHLGLRFGDEDSFSEAHFGPSDAGSFHEGFLKIGEGKVAQSEYLAEFPAGETTLTKEEALDWCRKWAKDKAYVMVGQNCWTMVHEFLTTHEGCELTEEIRFKEESVNGASQTLMDLITEVADEEDRPKEEIMQDLMDNPRSTLKRIFTAERLLEMTGVPDAIDNAVETGRDKIQDVRASQEGISVDQIKEKASNTQTMKSLEELRKDVASLFGAGEQ